MMAECFKDIASMLLAEARDYAGEKAGQYLEGVGTFSVADLTKAQWEEFLTIIIEQRAIRLRQLMDEFSPPF